MYSIESRRIEVWRHRCMKVQKYSTEKVVDLIRCTIPLVKYTEYVCTKRSDHRFNMIALEEYISSQNKLHVIKKRSKTRFNKTPHIHTKPFNPIAKRFLLKNLQHSKRVISLWLHFYFKFYKNQNPELYSHKELLQLQCLLSKTYSLGKTSK